MENPSNSPILKIMPKKWKSNRKRLRVKDLIINLVNSYNKIETTYKNNFIGQKPTVCPAKIQLETKSKGYFIASKDRFS